MHAYSQPMTPPPTTIIDAGMRSQREQRVAVDDDLAVDGRGLGLLRMRSRRDEK